MGMTDPNQKAESAVFKPRTSKWFAGIAWILAALGIVGAVAADGIDGLLVAWPMLAVAFLGWWAFWFPSITVDDNAVVIRNMVRSVTVPWNALIHVDTKYALTLVTTSGSYSAWAAPAPGIIASHRGKREHVEGLPASTYGAGRSIRPGDLSNSDSGAAALLVRSRWQQLAEADRLAIGAAETTKVPIRVHWLPIIAAAVLVIASAIALTLV